MHYNTENIVKVKVTLDEVKGYYSPLEVEECDGGFMVTYPIQYCLNGFNSFLKVLIPSTVSVDERGIKRWPFTIYFDEKETALEKKLANVFFGHERRYRAIRGQYCRRKKGELVFKIDDKGEDIALIFKGDLRFCHKNFFGKYDVLRFVEDRTLLLSSMDNFALNGAH